MPMIEVPKFAISKRLYAVKPDSFTATTGTGPPNHDPSSTLVRDQVSAIWFRRKNGALAIHYGTLWDYIIRPLEAANSETLDDFIHDYKGARYGGNTICTWNGTSFWGSDSSISRATEDGLIAMLDPMLSDFPNVPYGWLGWFQLTE